jgi:DNA-binding transcriptional regulator YiaG
VSAYSPLLNSWSSPPLPLFAISWNLELTPFPDSMVKSGVASKNRDTKSQWDADGIQALRRHLNLTQSELSAQLGTRQQTVSEWETGMYKPRGASAKLLSMIAEKARFKYDASPKKQ